MYVLHALLWFQVSVFQKICLNVQIFLFFFSFPIESPLTNMLLSSISVCYFEYNASQSLKLCKIFLTAYSTLNNQWNTYTANNFWIQETFLPKMSV